MIQEISDLFYEYYLRKKDETDVILKDYNLSQGNYYFIELYTGRIIEYLTVSKTDTDNNSKIYRNFVETDSLSTLLSMNKPIDGSKQIHSNNYLSFFIKKNLLTSDLNEDKLEKSITSYYSVFKDYSTKYDKDKMKILDSLNIEEDENRNKEISWVENWILENYRNFSSFPEFKDDKNYLKLFFVQDASLSTEGDSSDIEKFNRESKKYVVPNIYNTNKFNREVESEIYGVPNNNFNLNAKKPYLTNNSRIDKIPFMVSQEEIQKHKLLFDWLYSVASSGLVNIYIGKKYNMSGRYEPVADAIPNKEYFNYGENKYEIKFYGYYLRIKKGMSEADIIDYSPVIYSSGKELYYIENFLDLSEKEKVGTTYSSDIGKESFFKSIDQALYSNYLQNSLFLEAGEVSRNDSDLKLSILRTRELFIDWLYKFKDLKSNKILEDITLNLLIRHLKLNQITSMKNAYNVRKSLLLQLTNSEKNYEEAEMYNKIKEGFENGENNLVIGSDKEFGFCVGQLWFYLLSQSEAKAKNYDLLMPVIQTDSIDRIKTLTTNLVKKYGHAVNINSKKFNGLLSAVLTYESGKKFKATDLILAGFAYKNIMYTKSEENK